MFIIKSNVNNLKIVQEEFEDAKVVIRICKSKRDRQYNGKKEKGLKDKQRSTKHHTENKRSRYTNPTKTGGELRCCEKGKQLLLH